MSVKHKAVSSTLWTLTRVLLDQVFSFLVFVVVARLLGPTEVGLFTLGMIIVEVGRIISVSGFGDAVTKSLPDDEEEVSQAAFWGNMGLGLASAIILSALAYPFALLVHTPRLTEIAIALAWTIPISAGYAIHQARQLKRFGHKSLAIRALIAGVIGGGAAIGAAYAGAGVWSLVIQRLLTELITLATVWLSFRWVPGPSFSMERMKQIVPFSLRMSTSKVVDMLSNRFQDIVIGAYVSSAGVGNYRVAKRTIDMMTTGTLTSFSTVSLNVFATVQQDAARLRAVVLRTIAVSSTIAFPVFIGLGVVAGNLLPFIYGPKWHASVILFQLLVPIVVPGLFTLLCLSVLTIYGEARAISRITTIQFILTVILSLVSAPFGIEAVIIAFLARCYLIMPYQIHLVAKHAGCGIGTLLLGMARPLVAALLMGAACYFALLEVQLYVQWTPMRLMIIGALGALVYTAILWVIDRQSLMWLIELGRGYARRKDKTAAAGEVAVS